MAREKGPSAFSGPRIGSQVLTAEQSLKLVAPHHSIRSFNGRRQFYGGENSWQRMMMDVVICSNGFKNAMSQIDVEARNPKNLNIIMNDAFRFVANGGVQPHSQDRRANGVEAVLGWFPTIPLVWDLPMLAARAWRRGVHKAGLGAFYPALWTTLTDIPSRVFIPGSVPSSREAVGIYQQAMYHQFAEDTYNSLSTIDPLKASQEDRLLRRKYVDRIEQVSPSLISGAEKTMRRLTEKVLRTQGVKLKGNEKLPRLDENRVIASLSSSEVALYYLGQNLLDSVSIIRGMPLESSVEPSEFPQ